MSFIKTHARMRSLEGLLILPNFENDPKLREKSSVKFLHHF